jgi:protein tyrosine phosphatase (PTP) superfamily phosphohydrolase (DUF442 family)
VLSDIFNYLQVSATLATSGQPDVSELADIASAGYAVVLNIALHDDPRYSLQDEARTVRELGMHYVHIPVRFDAPTLDDFNSFAAAMASHRGSKLWVHCAANKRVSVFLGLYWYLHEGVPMEQAFALQREIWDPDEVWSRFKSSTLLRHSGDA